MNITELESEIRDRINRRRPQHELLSRVADWNRLCSALDVIGDTELALTAYLAQPHMESIGLWYVFAYGTLQLLEIQQDAVAHICKALRIKTQNSPKLPTIRMIRNNAVGHPFEENENKVTKSNFIVRSSLNQHGFSLMTVFSDGKPYSQRYVSIPQLVTEQQKALQKVLEEVIKKLDEAEMKHRTKHQDQRLSTAFADTLPYFFSKIFEAVYNPTYFPLGAKHVDFVAECLVQLRQLLEQRGAWGIHDSVNYKYELLEYPLAELKRFFAENASSKLNAKDAYIFCAFVQEQIKTLQQIAEEIDEEYAQVPKRGD